MPPLEAKRRSETTNDEQRKLVEQKEQLQIELRQRAWTAASTHPQPPDLRWPPQTIKASYRTDEQPHNERTRTWASVRWNLLTTTEPDLSEIETTFMSDRVTVDEDGTETPIEGSEIEQFSMYGPLAELDTGPGFDLSTEQKIDLLKDALVTMALIEEAGMRALVANTMGKTAVQAGAA